MNLDKLTNPRSVTVIVCVVLGLVLLGTFTLYMGEQRGEQRKARDRIKRQLNEASTRLERKVSVLKFEGEKIAAYITRNDARLNEKSLDKLVRRHLKVSKKNKERTGLHQKNSYSIAVVFHEKKFRKSLRLFAPIWVRKGEAVENYRPFAPSKANSDKYYDYIKDKERGAWYTSSFTAKTERWVAQWGTAVGDYVILYRAPFYRNGIEVGFVMVTMTIDQLRDIVTSVSIARGGYIVISMQNRRLLYHPDSRLISRDASQLRKNLDLRKIAERENNPLLQQLARANGIKKECLDSNRSFHDSVSGEDVFIIACSMKQTGWHFQGVIVENEAFAAQRRLSHYPFIFTILFVSIAFLICLHVLYWSKKRRSFLLSTLTSLIMTGGLMSLYAIVYSSGYPPAEHRRIYHQSDLHFFQETHKAKIHRQRSEQLGIEVAREQPLHYIPTGIFVESIELASGDNIALKGYVWQHYGPAHKGLRQSHRGFMFPGALQNDRFKIKDATYRDSFTKGGQKIEVFGWQFRTVIKQKFDFRKYPLDRHEIRIHMRYLDIKKTDVFLVPLLDSYSYTQAAKRPGLERELTLPSFSLQSSYFMYIPHEYTSDFGMEDFRRKNVEELYFVIRYRRNLFKPIVRHMVPISIMIIMLFFVLAATTNVQEKIPFFGSSLVNIVVASAGIFFVAVSNHLALRAHLTSDILIYLESFYLLLYLAILFVSATAYIKGYGAIFDSNRVIEWLNSREKGPKMLYFPVLTFLALIWTLFVFYPGPPKTSMPEKDPRFAPAEIREPTSKSK